MTAWQRDGAGEHRRDAENEGEKKGTWAAEMRSTNESRGRKGTEQETRRQRAGGRKTIGGVPVRVGGQ